MLTNFNHLLVYFGLYSQDIIVSVVIMVSAIIMAIGLLKPILFDRIKNKQIRKASLAFSNVAFCFISALVFFLIKGWEFKYYMVSAIALTVCCIVTYWLYENTCLRNLIAVIGNIALRKLATVAFIAVSTEDINEIKTEAKKVTCELKAQTKEALKKATTETKEDKDLRGL